jgi:hypothetical protein
MLAEIFKVEPGAGEALSQELSSRKEENSRLYFELKELYETLSESLSR